MKQKRLQILSKLFGDQIKKKIETEKLNISAKELLNKFSDYEITESGKYLEWMVKCYMGNGFLYEDLYKVKETLEIFHENKMKLSKDKRDIQQYKTLADLWIEVKKFVEQKDDFLSTNEQKRKEKELAYSETEFLYEDENVRLVAPLTENASKWWGKGTRWCTAAENNNLFMDYFWDAPLLIFDFKNGEKWQLWMFEEKIQFMDKDDRNIKINIMQQKWQYVENICRKILEINGLFIEYISFQNKTQELCEIAIKQNGLALKYIPYKFKTKELYENAVQQNGLALQYISNIKKTKELCRMAIKNVGSALKYSLWQNYEFRKLAVQQNGLNLQYLSPDEITPELCRIAVEQDGSNLLYVPKQYKMPLLKLALKDFANIKEEKFINKVHNNNLEQYKEIFLTLRQENNLKGI